MKKVLVTIITLVVLLTISGLIEGEYCHHLTTTPPPGAAADYIKNGTFCRLNSLPGAIGGILILDHFRDVKSATTQETVVDQKSATSSKAKESSVDSVSKVIDTTAWLEYRNNEYSFAIKYPPGWPVALVSNTITIGSTDPDPVDKYTKCYVKLVLNRPSEGNQRFVPHKVINSIISEMERSERCDETLSQIIKSYRSL